MAWRHRYLVALGLLLGLAGATVHYLRQTPVYQSTAQVLVIKKRADDMGVKSVSIEDYLATHQVLIKSPWVVNKTVEKGRLSPLRMFAGKETSIADEVLSRLTVQRLDGPSGGGSILEVTFRGELPDECGAVLNAVLDSYKEFLDETYASVSDETVKVVTEARNVLEKELREKEIAYTKFKQSMPTLLNGGDGDEHQELLGSIQVKKNQLVLRRHELQSQLDTIELARKEGWSKDQLLQLIADFAGKAESGDDLPRKPAELNELLLPLLQEEQRLSAEYGPRYPDLLEVRRRIEFTKKYYAQAAAAVGVLTRAADVGDPVEAHVQQVKNRLRQVAAAEQLLNELIDKERTEAGKLLSFALQDKNYRKDIDRVQDFYNGLVKRLHEAGLAQRAGGYDARIISPPGIGLRVAPRATPIYLTAAFLGLLLGLGIAQLAEATDRRFYSLEEVRYRLGFPIVGYIPLLSQPGREQPPVVDPEHTGLSPALVTFHRSRSMEAEAYRGVRTSLYFSTRGEAHHVIQVTSPSPGDGKTTLATNLAISIAQSGKRVLLIDADLRRPMIHKLFSMTNDVGLGNVIAGLVEPLAAVRDTGVENLSVLLTGPIPSNPAELLTSSRFKDVIDFFRSRFDLVILDTPPVLAVSDPCAVAPRVDGVLLVLRIVKNCRPMAERAKEILTALGVTVFGVVVNALEDKTITGYGYGYYAYRYRYRYGYGYGSEGRGDNGQQEAGAGENGEANGTALIT